MSQYYDPRETGVRIIATFDPVTDDEIARATAPAVGLTEDAVRDLLAEQNTIEFVYDQPNVAVDTSARYVDHDIIGGMTVRQRIGEDPRQVTVSGFCTKEEAVLIDRLYQTDFIEFESFRTGRITAQVTSASTDVHSDGGSVAIEGEGGESTIVYKFDISLVEV